MSRFVCLLLFVAFVCFGGFLDSKSWYNKLDCVFLKERKKERKKESSIVGNNTFRPYYYLYHSYKAIFYM